MHKKIEILGKWYSPNSDMEKALFKTLRCSKEKKATKKPKLAD